MSLTVITVTELSRHTSAIVQRCEEGEVFLITRRGVPAVIMRPLTDEERAASNSTERVEIDSDLLSQARAVLDPDGELSDSEVVHLALRTGIRTQQRACERAE
ncbi:type II toxin-antitoxin system Phd/YefM family antitoxin [Leifsonia xyli]|uniref:type II toxin-antitoxin system Phd/YefM family antitoxin n=1 Tax=Leifsonia xyli TaxID=1575 RepID=UPI003D67984B